MAQASIVDRAIGLIPGVGKGKRAKRAPTKESLVAGLQRKLAKLADEVESLSRLIGKRHSRDAAKTPAGSRQPRKPRSSKATKSRTRVRAAG